jgi:hypothetical protein
VKVGFRQSFAKDLEGVKAKSLLRRVKATIETVEKAESLDQINGLKKLKGGGNYYRLRIGISVSVWPWKAIKSYSCGLLTKKTYTDIFHENVRFQARQASKRKYRHLCFFWIFQKRDAYPRLPQASVVGDRVQVLGCLEENHPELI